MLANYHTHTARCGHAIGEDREYVENAIQAGMKVLGFSDHCPWVFPDGYESPIRMRLQEVDGYFSSLTKLRDEYKDDITIYIGFESEFIPELLDAQDKFLADYPVDYQIMGQHYTSREPETVYCGRVVPRVQAPYFREYVESCIAGIESGRYKYLAHPDLMGMLDPAIYREGYAKLCACIKAHDMPVELNCIGIERHYTSRAFLKIAAEFGCKAIIGIDAHQPEKLLGRTGVDVCQELAEETGLELIDYLPGMGPK